MVLHHLRGHDAGGGHADEHIGPRQHVRQGAGPSSPGLVTWAISSLIQFMPVAAAGVDGAACGRTGSTSLHPAESSSLVMEMAAAPAPLMTISDVLHLLAHHLQGVGEAGQGDDGGAVLVVVEDGDVAPLLQLPLDLKAAGGGDVLQIHAAEGAGQQVHTVFTISSTSLAADAQGNGVHAAEGLEQDALALHDGHPGLRADVPQAQHGGAVGDHGHGVPPAGQLIALAEVLLDLQAGLGHAGGVGQGQRLLAVHRGPGASPPACPSTRNAGAGIPLRNP